VDTSEHGTPPYGDPALATSGVERAGWSASVVALHVVATVLLAVGFVAVAVTLWALFVTVDDGGGANIGAGILGVFGLGVGALGLVVLAAAGSAAAVTRVRRRRAH